MSQPKTQTNKQPETRAQWELRIAIKQGRVDLEKLKRQATIRQFSK